MSPTLDRGLAALEAVNRAANDFVLSVRRLISPGVEAGEATFATALGQRFTREPSETEDAFIDRIHDYAKAHRSAGQFCVRAFIDHDFEL